MVLLNTVTYRARIKNPEELTSESVVALLKDVREDIQILDKTFGEKTLAEVLKIVEAGEYTVDRRGGRPLTQINLEDAHRLINAYRYWSDRRGCNSCIQKARDNSDACEPSDSFFYCIVHEPNVAKTKRECGYNAGFSPYVKKHMDSPCGFWKSKLFPPIEVLVESADAGKK